MKEEKKEHHYFRTTFFILILLIVLLFIYGFYIGNKGMIVKEYYVNETKIPSSFDNFKKWVKGWKNY